MDIMDLYLIASPPNLTRAVGFGRQTKDTVPLSVKTSRWHVHYYPRFANIVPRRCTCCIDAMCLAA